MRRRKMLFSSGSIRITPYRKAPEDWHETFEALSPRDDRAVCLPARPRAIRSRLPWSLQCHARCLSRLRTLKTHQRAAIYVSVLGYRMLPSRSIADRWTEVPQYLWVYLANILSFEDRPVPCFVTCQTLIDQPRIQLAAIGIQSNLSARLKSLQLAAPAARNPRLRGNFRCDGPPYPKSIAHSISVFHFGSSPRRRMRCPFRARYGGVLSG